MTLRIILALLAATALAAPALAQQKTIKYAHFQPARDDQPKHRAALAFKAHVEKNTNGQVTVQIFPAGQFGKDQETMEGLRLGTLEMAVAHDGAIATVHKPIGVLGIPFVFDNHAQAWKVYDSKWGETFAEDMRKKTGIRMLGVADNGIRHFTNNVRPIKTPDDMKGLKIRIQPSPVFKTLVESLGASASAIPWADLPTALQGRVVDGQENSVTNILAASLYQYQKHITLDGHVYSIHAYMINDRFFSGLTPEQQRVVTEGAKIARDIHRKMTSEQDLAAKKILTEKGMQVTEIGPAEIEAFRKLAQPPVVAWANQEIGKDYVDALLAAVKAGGS